MLEANESPPIFGIYVVGHHTRPKNKLRWRFKLMDNPQLKDLVINVDENTPPKGKEKAQTKPRNTTARPKSQVSKAEGLKILSSVINSLH